MSWCVGFPWGLPLCSIECFHFSMLEYYHHQFINFIGIDVKWTITFANSLHVDSSIHALIICELFNHFDTRRVLFFSFQTRRLFRETRLYRRFCPFIDTTHYRYSRNIYKLGKTDFFLACPIYLLKIKLDLHFYDKAEHENTHYYFSGDCCNFFYLSHEAYIFWTVSGLKKVSCFVVRCRRC